ncbi:hypothetical protein M9H77_08437 [Catharanthus roseus]|uniref:Uncharacterized protein n=1 Tax=Catharanthus roseus TaxID=4058 RepID=A0ACC0BXZ6_CATRO|nr:hypothetical protein M9H77_08437 [Catharanthus roseus]
MSPLLRKQFMQCNKKTLSSVILTKLMLEPTRGFRAQLGSLRESRHVSAASTPEFKETRNATVGLDEQGSDPTTRSSSQYQSNTIRALDYQTTALPKLVNTGYKFLGHQPAAALIVATASVSLLLQISALFSTSAHAAVFCSSSTSSSASTCQQQLRFLLQLAARLQLLATCFAASLFNRPPQPPVSLGSVFFSVSCAAAAAFFPFYPIAAALRFLQFCGCFSSFFSFWMLLLVVRLSFLFSCGLAPFYFLWWATPFLTSFPLLPK